jgi:plastocyanin
MDSISGVTAQAAATLRRVVAVGCLGYSLFGGMTANAAPQGAAVPKTYTVTIEGLRFSPATLTVTAGDRIVWINKDPFPHTVTADAKAFDSRDVAAGSSWQYTPRRSGEYPYGCTYHPSMKGTLVVRSKPTQEPGT